MTPTSHNPPDAPKRKRWPRVLLWLGVAYLAINILPFVWTTVTRTIGHPLFLFLGTVVAVLAFSIPYGGLNLLRTAFNPKTADFVRRDDPERGGFLYEVRPARASWLAVLVPLPLCALLATWGVLATWMLYASTALYLFVAAIFVMPGARDRRPVTISVSPEGIHSGVVQVPLDRVAELDIVMGGVKVAEDPLLPGPNGVPVSSTVGRGLGRRQAARSLALRLRADGESQASVIAGGLTPDCARNLLRDIEQAIARFAGPASGAG